MAITTYDWEAPPSGGVSPFVGLYDSSYTGSIEWSAEVEYYGVIGEEWLSLSDTAGFTPFEFTMTATPHRRYFHRYARVIVTPSGIDDPPDTILVEQNIMFEPPVNYSVGSEPVCVVSADVNGDNHLDLVTANEMSNDVSVLIGSGNGSFVTAVNYNVGEGPSCVFASDLNDDGDIDLVTADVSSETFSVLFNNHNGTFQSAVSYAVEGIRSVIAADFDWDGDNDLAVTANQPESFPLYDGKVSIWFNDGGGNFQQGDSLYGDMVVFAVGHDFDDNAAPNSTYADLALISSKPMDNIQVLLHNGGGDFQTSGTYSVGDYPRAAFARDVENDGDVDHAVINASYCSVLRNNGDGTFQDPEDYLVEAGTYSVGAGDFDRDYYHDLVIADYVHDCLVVLMNRGDGTFSDFADRDYYPVGDLSTFTFGEKGAADGPRSICIADFNGDGDSDIAVANSLSGTVSVLSNNWAR
ncbi:MAG: VCBS repeat-containing protein [Candidatus Zixiibacteriota bacterium]|nr:MAG: VCBS repeat-containing protein [candidate division Zixibacteria bacterium]